MVPAIGNRKQSTQLTRGQVTSAMFNEESSEKKKKKKYYLSSRNENANVSSGISARGDFQRKIQYAYAYETK